MKIIMAPLRAGDCKWPFCLPGVVNSKIDEAEQAVLSIEREF